MRIVIVLTIPAFICQGWLQLVSEQPMVRSSYGALFILTLSWYLILWSYYYLVKGQINSRHPDWSFMDGWQVAVMVSTLILCAGWWRAKAGA